MEELSAASTRWPRSSTPRCPPTRPQPAPVRGRSRRGSRRTAAPMPLPAIAGMPACGRPAPPATARWCSRSSQQQMQLMAQQLALLSAARDGPRRAQRCRRRAPAQPAPAAAAAATAVPTPAAAPTPRTRKPRRAHEVRRQEGLRRHRAHPHRRASELTERQRARLDGLHAPLHRAHAQKSKAYTAQHRPHLADPRVVNGFRPLTKEIIYQIVIERSQGLAPVGHRRQRVRRRAQRLRHEPVRLAAGLRQRRGAQAARPRLRDRPAAPAGRRGRAS